MTDMISEEIIIETDKNKVFTLWVEGLLDEFTKIAIKSWLRLGYEVDLFMYDEPNALDIAQFPEVNFLDAGDFVSKPPLENYAEIADYFRFNYLFCDGGTWLDSDLILIKRLPEDQIIISSEHARFGSFQPIGRDFSCNIGVLRFPPYSLILLETVTKVNTAINRGLKQNSNRNNLMKIFQKIIHKDHLELVSNPNDYCPINWSYAKELYTKPDIVNVGKYGIDQKNMDWIFSNSYGVHLWRNLAISKGWHANQKENSVFNILKKYILLENNYIE